MREIVTIVGSKSAEKIKADEQINSLAKELKVVKAENTKLKAKVMELEKVSTKSKGSKPAKVVAKDSLES